MAVSQGLLTGPTVKTLGEWNTVIFALVTSIIAAVGYGFAPSITIVILLFVIHAPEGFAQPALTALMSREAPENAQGELQGGHRQPSGDCQPHRHVFFFAQAFSWFMRPNPRSS